MNGWVDAPSIYDFFSRADSGEALSPSGRHLCVNELFATMRNEIPEFNKFYHVAFVAKLC
jgi:hypothetical protein